MVRCVDEVIAGLEICLALRTIGTHVGCPYRRDGCGKRPYPECHEEMMRDALVLLTEYRDKQERCGMS